MWWLRCSCRSELTVVAVRATEQRSVWRDGHVSDGGSQARQEVALVFSVFPLDQNRLDSSAQQVGAWAEKQNTHNRRQSRNLSPDEESGICGSFTFRGEAQRVDCVVVPVQGGVGVLLFMVKVSPGNKDNRK